MLDTRTWNIVPLAALAATSCRGADEIPVDTGTESEATGTGDGDGDPTTSGDGDGDPTTSGDGDGDGDPTTSGDPTTTGDDYYEYPECGFGDGSCHLGEECVSQECQPIAALPECGPLSFVELPIPAAAQGEILDLAFADLDDDGVDELLVLHVGELVLVRDAETSVTIPVDPEADELSALHVDIDGNLDLLLTSTLDDHAAALLGVGDGTLMAPLDRTLVGLRHTRAIDWTNAASEELLGIDAQGEVLRVSDLSLDVPSVATLDIPLLGEDQVVAVHPGSIAEGGALLVQIFDGLRSGFVILDDSENIEGMREFYFGPGGDHDPHTALIPDNNQTGAFVFAFQYGSEADLHLYDGVDDGFPDRGLIDASSIEDMGHVEGLGLVLATSSGTTIVELGGSELGCVISPPELPASTRVAAGAFAANPGEELALVDGQGQLRVWGR